MISWLKRNWISEGGYRDLLKLALPLILSTSSWTIQQVVDRIFLAWYSPSAVAAALPAGILNTMLLSLATGTASYVGTFVAQYAGSGQSTKIGPVVWQGVYFSLIAGFLMLFFLPLSAPGFRLAGHPPEVQSMETVYFRTLLYGAFPAAASSALAGFFSGRGKTWAVMGVTAAATAVNIILDYTLIFGKWGFAVLGIYGAALATVISQILSFALYWMLLAKPAYQKRFHTFSGWRFDPKLFRRFVRFGFPSGLHFSLDSIGFALFILMVGQYGTVPLAATNIAFNINNFAFMPMIGFGMATSIFVGQKLGENRPQTAQRGAWSAFHLTFFYMMAVAGLYVLVPGWFLLPYAYKADPGRFPPIATLSKFLLRFVAAYSLFDTMNIVFASAIKGAGDTRFVMWMSVALSWLILIVPTYVASSVLHLSLTVLWTIVTVYISAVGLVFWFRFRSGHWKTMRVIAEISAEIHAL